MNSPARPPLFGAGCHAKVMFRMLAILGLCGVAAVAIWIGTLLAPNAPIGSTEAPSLLIRKTQPSILPDPPPPVESPVGFVEEPHPLLEEWPEGAIKGDLLLSFSNPEALETIAREARRLGLPVERIPELLALRVRGLDAEQLTALRRLAGDGALAGFNTYIVTPDPVPALEEGRGGRRPFRDGALDWLGVPEDNYSWGRGVRIAILDTGIDASALPPGAVAGRLDLVDARDGGAPGNGTHGTAVAALLVGGNDMRGISPAAQVLDIRVLDGDGVGNAFTLARGIVEAANLGAQFINVSLGAYSHTDILYNATQYAAQMGAVVIAATGNDGAGQVLFPARYPGVVGVTAIDADARLAGFSNWGPGVDLAAPGVGLLSIWPETGSVMISGTSFSAPLVAGGAAGLMSIQPGLTPSNAIALMQQFANDTGLPGHDDFYGSGEINFDRTLNRDVPGIHDAAVASHFLAAPRADGLVPLVLTVQNRGTEWLGNVDVVVEIEDRRQAFHLSGMRPGAVEAMEFMIDPATIATPGGFRVRSAVNARGVSDSRPYNNTRASLFQPVEP